MHSRRISNMYKNAIRVPSLPINTEIYDCPIFLKLNKFNKSTSSTRKATQCNRTFLSTLALSCSPLKMASAFVASAACMAKCVTYSCVTILVTHFTVVLFSPRLLPSSGSPNGLPPRALDPWSIPNVSGRTLEGLDLFTQVGYVVEPTAPNSSH
jgi:hypothetical protein